MLTTKIFSHEPGFTLRMSTLHTGLHGLRGAWLRCNALEWNNHSASLRVADTLHGIRPSGQPRAVQIRSGRICALHHESRALRYVQPRVLG